VTICEVECVHLCAIKCSYFHQPSYYQTNTFITYALVQVVRLLVEVRKCQIDVQDVLGNTPLQYSTM